MEMNENGTITGKYSGTQLATVEGTMNQDGTSSWNGKFMHMTNKGDMIVAVGHGTSKPSDKKRHCSHKWRSHVDAVSDPI